MNYAGTAAAMTDVQFELLLRARMRLERDRMGAINRNVTFTFSCSFGTEGEMQGAKWSTSVSYDTSTKGERLGPVVTETRRRYNWDVSPEASLLLVEGPSAPDGDQTIPF